ncbi:MAG: hypothetical protein ABI864_02770 [Chloroflexota bacterium]
MSESRSSRLAAGAHTWARLALGLMVIGPSILLVYAWVEVLNNPGYTLVDGYWIGRLPWTPLGVVISLVGGVAGLAAGSVAIAIDGGWWRRFLIVPCVAAAAMWWLTAIGVIPYPRFKGPDPVGFAYDLPTAAMLMLLMPAALLAALCLRPPITPEAHTRLRLVPQREPWSEPPPDAG